jgi:membrane protease subunit (stomatin/prohibitin family)
MTLWEKAKAEFIDIIEWADDSSDTMVWRFPITAHKGKLCSI